MNQPPIPSSWSWAGAVPKEGASRNCAKWVSEEEQALLKAHRMGATIAQLAVIHRRLPQAIAGRIERLTQQHVPEAHPQENVMNHTPAIKSQRHELLRALLDGKSLQIRDMLEPDLWHDVTEDLALVALGQRAIGSVPLRVKPERVERFGAVCLNPANSSEGALPVMALAGTREQAKKMLPPWAKDRKMRYFKLNVDRQTGAVTVAMLD